MLAFRTRFKYTYDIPEFTINVGGIHSLYNLMSEIAMLWQVLHIFNLGWLIKSCLKIDIVRLSVISS